MARRVFITVGEASGDQHAGQLIQAMRALDSSLVFEGLGGQSMRAAGATVHSDTVQHATMGWKAAVRYFEIRRLLYWSQSYFRQNPPDLQICIDSWSMNWHWARLATEQGVPVLYYIAPQAWASRAGRVKRLAKYVDRIACILPFEEKFFRDFGLDATFVGHPLFDTLPPAREENSVNHFPNRPPVIGLAPGSRESVARDNFPNILEVADRILAAFPSATFVIPTVAATQGPVTQNLRAWQARHGRQTSTSAAPVIDGLQTIGPFTFGTDRFDELVSRCDLCIAVSGTATLHIAGHGVPLIVVYRLNPIFWHLAGRFIVKTRTFSLVNLLNDTHQQIVPEFIPWYGSNNAVAEKALEMLRNPQLLAEQHERLRNLIRALNKPGASRNAAILAMELLNGRKSC
jgi:lipid-A-disaccharide synthase